MISKDKVINVKFNRIRKGYDIEQVDKFLDEIVEDISVIEAERQADAERMLKVQESENALAQALLIAQKTANDLETKANEQAQKTIDDANAQADEIINNAKIEAYNIREKYETELANLKAEVERMQKFVADYKKAVVTDMDQQKAAFLESFSCEAMTEPAEETEAFEEDLPTEVSEEAAEVPVEAEPEVEAAPETEEPAEETDHEQDVVESSEGDLQTENIETINLDDILTNLPESDDELKALIDEIME